GDFAFPGTAFPMLIKAGQSNAIKMTCIPSTVTTRTATLKVSTNDPTHAQVTFNLTCTGKPLVDSTAPWTITVLTVLLSLSGVTALRGARARMRHTRPGAPTNPGQAAS